MNEHTCKCTVTENVNALDKGIIDAGTTFKWH